jgi:hypothetical protein
MKRSDEHPQMIGAEIPKVALMAAALLGCAKPMAVETTQVASSAPQVLGDSIVLERSRCLGTCPVYRLRLAANGNIVFESHNGGSPEPASRDSIAPAEVAKLFAKAEEISFYEFPDVIDRTDSDYCPIFATDHPTFAVTIFARSKAKRVSDYSGCYVATGPLTVHSGLRKLRLFEDSIDSTAMSKRWIRPNSR